MPVIIARRPRLFWLGLFLSILIVAVGQRPPAASGQSSAVEGRFGLIETYDSPAHAAEAGAAWTRAIFHWGEIQAGGPDTWTPKVSDEQIEAEVAAGRLVVGLLIGIPDWARAENKLPRGLSLPTGDPDNTWAAFVRQAATRYRGRIDHWIIWNEPDIWDGDAPGHTWDSTVEAFFQLHRTAYLAAKEANPEAAIHLAAMTYFWDAQYGRPQYLERLLDAVVADPQAAANHYYFDAVSAHLYFQPDLIYKVIQEYDGMIQARGIPDKPIWLVETNAPPIDDSYWPVPNYTLKVSLYEQAAFIPQALAAALAAGAERVAVYKLRDVPGDRQANPEPFGLVRTDGSRRPAFSTFRVATQMMAGVERAWRERWDGVGQIHLDQSEQATTVLFARLPRPQRVEVPAYNDEGAAVLIDMWGERRTLTAWEGVFTIELPAALCAQSIGDYCMIGGTTYYLVQKIEAGLAPTPPAAPTAVPTAKPTPTQIPLATPTPGARAAPLAEAGLISVQGGAMALHRPTPTVMPLEVGIERNTASVDFPESVTFDLSYDPATPVLSAVLTYDVAKWECVEVGTQAPVEVAEGGRLSWTWVMSRSGNPPPGTTLWWQWTLAGADGATFTTPRQEITLEDGRFPWRTVVEEGIRLHWYEGDEVGPLLLEAAVEGLARLEGEMGIALQDDVTFYIYGAADDMREAVLYIQDWAGGVAFAEYNTILIGVPPSIAEEWGRSTVRHELAHLVVDQFARSCLGGSRPTWLEEGLAVYAEGEPRPEILADIAAAVEEDTFEPVRSLNGAFPAHGREAGIAYSQSFSLVAFLLEEYGREKMKELLLTLAAGESYDDALQHVYGFNVDGLEVTWRQAIGAQPRLIPPTPTAITAAAIATVAPLGAPESVPTPESLPGAPEAAGGGGVCSLALVPLLLVILAVGRTARRSSRKAAKDAKGGG